VPTYSTTRQFKRDYAKLGAAEKAAFKDAMRKFVADLRGKGFRKGLRVKRVQGTSGVFEMTWADDGRATFEYGEEIRSGEPHVIWRRCGGHEIFGRP
jgi:hypothetical protein